MQNRARHSEGERERRLLSLLFSVVRLFRIANECEL